MLKLLQLISVLPEDNSDLSLTGLEAAMKKEDRLQMLTTEMEQLLYAISHDLRAPLRAVEGFSRVLAEDYSDRLGEEGARILGIVLDNARQLDCMVSDLLALSRITRQEIKLSEIHMADLAESVFLAVTDPEKRARFPLTVREMPAARGDVVLIKKVWQNLFDNALKFSPGDKVCPVEAGGYTEGAYHIYYVKDSGIGFSPEYASRIFGVFQRLHSGKFAGTGMGLALVHKIISRHGGRVWARGEVNRGAQVFFSLPVIPLPERDPDLPEIAGGDHPGVLNEIILKLILNSLPIGIAVNSLSPAVTFSYMNDNFARIYRTSKKDLAEPDSFWEKVYEDKVFREKIRQQVLEDCASGDPRRMHWAEVPLQRQGQTYYITARNIPIPGTPLTISTVWDVTDYRRQRDALLQEQREKNLILDNLSELVTYLDTDMRIIWANRMAIEYHRKKPEEFIGRQCYEVWHNYSEPCAGCPVQAAINTGGVCRGETRSPDGRYWQVNATPIHGPDGRVTGVLDTALDITGLKLTEEALKKLNAELEQRVRERTAELESLIRDLDAFAYSVSHDLRAPLRSIDGFSQAIQEEYGDRLDERGMDYLCRVRAASQHLDVLIDDMLRLSRVSRQEIRRRRVDLSAMVAACLDKLRAREPERKVEVVVAPQQTARGDVRLLGIALENLLDNAWKFTVGRPVARIEFGVTRQKGRKVFFIRDNGAGFDMAYVGKLFNAFQRLHDTGQFPGTGIGLSIVARVISRHGGEVWAEGETGKGATFYFTLPL